MMVERFVAIHTGAGRGLLPRLIRNTNPRCMDTDGFYVDQANRDFVAALAETADLVWVFGLLAPNALRRWHWTRAVLDIDDVPSQLHRAHSAIVDGAERIRAVWHTRLWRSRERLLGERFRDIVVCSDEDRRYLEGTGAAIHVVRNTFDDSELTLLRRPSKIPRFGFIGTLGYAPNRDAVEWFGRVVWPEIRRVFPEAELRIVGIGGAELVREKNLPATALGYVEDPTEEMATWTAMIIPIRFGGGTRIKISEAFARRIPVVSTRLGAFGYDVADGREVLLADEPSDFARACVRVARDSEFAERMTAEAWRLYQRKYRVEAVRRQVIAAAECSLRRTP